MRSNIDMMITPLLKKFRREKELNPYIIFPAATVALMIALPLAFFILLWLYANNPLT